MPLFRRRASTGVEAACPVTRRRAWFWARSSLSIWVLESHSCQAEAAKSMMLRWVARNTLPKGFFLQPQFEVPRQARRLQRLRTLSTTLSTCCWKDRVLLITSPRSLGQGSNLRVLPPIVMSGFHLASPELKEKKVTTLFSLRSIFFFLHHSSIFWTARWTYLLASSLLLWLDQMVRMRSSFHTLSYARERSRRAMTVCLGFFSWKPSLTSWIIRRNGLRNFCFS